jgi:hypothetical protein
VRRVGAEAGRGRGAREEAAAAWGPLVVRAEWQGERAVSASAFERRTPNATDE